MYIIFELIFLPSLLFLIYYAHLAKINSRVYLYNQTLVVSSEGPRDSFGEPLWDIQQEVRRREQGVLIPVFPIP